MPLERSGSRFGAFFFWEGQDIGQARKTPGRALCVVFAYLLGKAMHQEEPKKYLQLITKNACTLQKSTIILSTVKQFR